MAARTSSATLSVRSSLSRQSALTPTRMPLLPLTPDVVARRRASVPESPMRRRAAANAPTTNSTVDAQKELMEPTVAIRPAPIAGPKIQAIPMNPSWMPFRRSRPTFDAFATSASMVFLAVYPAGSKVAPAMAIRRMIESERPTVSAAIGKAATESAERRSAPMLTVRRPM